MSTSQTTLAARPQKPSPDGVPADLWANRVLTLDAVAKVADFSLSTLRREIQRGRGPKICRISERRVGVRAGDLQRWLEERTVGGA
jgi:predicted DNA-binding transcriptional regulator AlpA